MTHSGNTVFGSNVYKSWVSGNGFFLKYMCLCVLWMVSEYPEGNVSRFIATFIVIYVPGLYL